MVYISALYDCKRHVTSTNTHQQTGLSKEVVLINRAVVTISAKTHVRKIAQWNLRDGQELLLRTHTSGFRTF